MRFLRNAAGLLSVNLMLYIFINFLSVILGSLIGSLAKRGINEKYLQAMSTAMGVAILVLGINIAMQNMQKSQMPVLFLFCLVLGGLLGTVMRLDERMEKSASRLNREAFSDNDKSDLVEGIISCTLLCCVGTLAMMGPILSAIYGDNTYLVTAATLNLITAVIIASTYGFGIALSGIPIFLWMTFFFLLGKFSSGYITDDPNSISFAIITETNIVGGILIAASGLGVLHIKDCKTVNLLPALLLPLIYFFVTAIF